MLFQEPVLFELPVLPRVQKYIRTKLRDASGKPKPLLATPTPLGIGTYLWAMAQTELIHLPTRRNRKKPTSHYQPEAFTARLGIGIYQFHHTRHQHLLSHPELIVLSNLVDHLIQNELVRFCQLVPQTAPMTRIKAFCDEYDFSEQDYSEAALKQLYLRYRKGKASHGYDPVLTESFQYLPVPQAA